MPIPGPTDNALRIMLGIGEDVSHHNKPGLSRAKRNELDLALAALRKRIANERLRPADADALIKMLLGGVVSTDSLHHPEIARIQGNAQMTNFRVDSLGNVYGVLQGQLVCITPVGAYQVVEPAKLAGRILLFEILSDDRLLLIEIASRRSAVTEMVISLMHKRNLWRHEITLDVLTRHHYDIKVELDDHYDPATTCSQAFDIYVVLKPKAETFEQTEFTSTTGVHRIRWEESFVTDGAYGWSDQFFDAKKQTAWAGIHHHQPVLLDYTSTHTQIRVGNQQPKRVSGHVLAHTVCSDRDHLKFVVGRRASSTFWKRDVNHNWSHERFDMSGISSVQDLYGEGGRLWILRSHERSYAGLTDYETGHSIRLEPGQPIGDLKIHALRLGWFISHAQSHFWFLDRDKNEPTGNPPGSRKFKIRSGYDCADELIFLGDLGVIRRWYNEDEPSETVLVLYSYKGDEYELGSDIEGAQFVFNRLGTKLYAFSPGSTLQVFSWELRGMIR